MSSPIVLNVLPLTGVGGSEGSLHAGDARSVRLGAESDMTGAVTERTNFICRATCALSSVWAEMMCVFGDVFAAGLLTRPGDVTLRCKVPFSTVVFA